MSETDYLFDAGSELGREHVDALAAIFDRTTVDVLAPTGIRPGRRCLELGAGGGSIARWMAERTGATGTVVATDIDTSHLAERPGLRIHQHDLDYGLPLPGPFDVIHARLLLQHLPRREEIFDELVDALAPGGWLVLGDLCRTPYPLAAPTESDLELLAEVWRTLFEVVGPAAGVDFTWAHRVRQRMSESRLRDIHLVEYSATASGNTPHAMALSNLVRQAEQPMLAAGRTAEELDRYHRLMRDPDLLAWGPRLIYARGREAGT